MDDGALEPSKVTSGVEPDSVTNFEPTTTPYVRSLSEELAQAEEELKLEISSSYNLESDRSLQSFLVEVAGTNTETKETGAGIEEQTFEEREQQDQTFEVNNEPSENLTVTRNVEETSSLELSSTPLNNNQDLIEVNVTTFDPTTTPYVRSLSEELVQAEKDLKHETSSSYNFESDRFLQGSNTESKETIADLGKTITEAKELQEQKLDLTNNSENLTVISNTEPVPTLPSSESSPIELKETQDSIEIDTEISVTDSKPFAYAKNPEPGQYCCPEPQTHSSPIQTNSNRYATGDSSKKRKATDTVDSPLTRPEESTKIEFRPSSPTAPSVISTDSKNMTPMISVAIQTKFTTDSGTNTDQPLMTRYYPADQIQSPLPSLSYHDKSFEQINLDIVEPVTRESNQTLTVKDEPDVAIATALTVGTALVTGVSTLFKVLRLVFSIIPWSTIGNVISGVSTVVTGLETVQTILKYLRRIPLVGRIFKAREPTGPVSVEVQTMDPNCLPLTCLQCGRCLKDLPCCPVCSMAPTTSVSQIIVPVVHVSPGPASPRQRLTSVSLIVDSAPSLEKAVDPMCVTENPEDQIAQESRVLDFVNTTQPAQLPMTTSQETTIDNCQRGDD